MICLKLQAPSSKHQAPGTKLQAPSSKARVVFELEKVVKVSSKAPAASESQREKCTMKYHPQTYGNLPLKNSMVIFFFAAGGSY